MFLKHRGFFMKKVKGFTKVDNENILFNMDLSPFSKLVYTYLVYYTRNGTGVCFCLKTTLSKLIGISLYHLRKSLCELEKYELINITRRRQGNPDDIRVNDFKVKPEPISSLIPLYEEDCKEKKKKDSPNTISSKTTEISSSEKTVVPETNTNTTTTTTTQPVLTSLNTPTTSTEVSSSEKTVVPETNTNTTTQPVLTSLNTPTTSNNVKYLPEPTERLKNQLQSILRPPSYGYFFKSLKVLELDEQEIKIGIEYSVLQNDIIQVYIPTIQKIIGVSNVHFVPMKGLSHNDV